MEFDTKILDQNTKINDTKTRHSQERAKISEDDRAAEEQEKIEAAFNAEASKIIKAYDDLDKSKKEAEKKMEDKQKELTALSSDPSADPMKTLTL